VSESVLADKISLVTGGARGIGAGIAEMLAELGSTVVICGRSLQALEATAQKIGFTGGQCEAIQCDVTDWNSVAAMANRIEQTFGRLDILVNNAGVGSFDGPLHTMRLEDWDTIFNTNLRGVFYTMRAFTSLMIKTGRGDIINISSIASKNPLPNGAAYAASKWGLNGLSYSVAEELRAKNIRVTVVCPGSVHTEFSPHAGKDSSKMLQPEDVAHVVKMLVTQQPRSFASEVVLRPTQKP
jgi:3-oxoacyl-[acyl-carrier protein] reductase